MLVWSVLQKKPDIENSTRTNNDPRVVRSLLIGREEIWVTNNRDISPVESEGDAGFFVAVTTSPYNRVYASAVGL